MSSLVQHILVRLVVTFIVLTSFSNCTIQKRVHRKGWHIEWNKTYKAEKQQTTNDDVLEFERPTSFSVSSVATSDLDFHESIGKVEEFNESIIPARAAQSESFEEQDKSMDRVVNEEKPELSSTTGYDESMVLKEIEEETEKKFNKKLWIAIIVISCVGMLMAGFLALWYVFPFLLAPMVIAITLLLRNWKSKKPEKSNPGDKKIKRWFWISLFTFSVLGLTIGTAFLFFLAAFGNGTLGLIALPLVLIIPLVISSIKLSRNNEWKSADPEVRQIRQKRRLVIIASLVLFLFLLLLLF